MGPVGEERGGTDSPNMYEGNKGCKGKQGLVARATKVGKENVMVNKVGEDSEWGRGEVGKKIRQGTKTTKEREERKPGKQKPR